MFRYDDFPTPPEDRIIRPVRPPRLEEDPQGAVKLVVAQSVDSEHRRIPLGTVVTGVTETEEYGSTGFVHGMIDERVVFRSRLPLAQLLDRTDPQSVRNRVENVAATVVLSNLGLAEL